MIGWTARWLGQGDRRHVITLRQGPQETSMPIWLGDSITVSDDVSEFAEVELLGDRHVRITIRSDEERLSGADLEYLARQPVRA
jgi:hypothetical protein